MYQTGLSSPLGSLLLTEEEGFITELEWRDNPLQKDDTPLLREAKEQLNAYFAGKLKVFSLPLAPQGTVFRKKIWDILLTVPYGATLTYGEVAALAKTAPRAVGGAAGKNPIAIIIPCHRILGTAGLLTGYSGGCGTLTKQALLDLENIRQFQRVAV